MQVWVEKTGEFGDFVDVPQGSTIKDCLEKAGVSVGANDTLYLNGYDTLNSRKVDLSNVVKEKDTVQIVPHYSGGVDFRQKIKNLPRASGGAVQGLPSLCARKLAGFEKQSCKKIKNLFALSIR